MRSVGDRLVRWLASVARGWERFWFEPQSSSTLGVVRILTGIVLLFFIGSLVPDYSAFVSSHGLLPENPSVPWAFNLYGAIGGGALAWILLVVFTVASVALLVGWHTRVAAVLVLACLLSVERRMPYVFNSGDVLLRLVVLYLCLAPAGAALSLDRRRQVSDTDDWWVAPYRAPWGQRLIQIQLSVVYLATVWAKVRGTTWNDGTAVSYALRLTDLTRFRVPGVLVDNVGLVNLLTWGTLAVELGVGILVWNRRARPAVLVLGVLLHLSIHLSLLVGLFSLVMLCCYVAFIEGEDMDRAVDQVRRWWQQRRNARIAVVGQE